MEETNTRARVRARERNSAARQNPRAARCRTPIDVPLVLTENEHEKVILERDEEARRMRCQRTARIALSS